MESQKLIQVGCIIRIKLEPPRAKRTGFLLDTEHVIQEPPKNYLNSRMGVWLKDNSGKLVNLLFTYWVTTNKKSETKRIRLR